jgi:hypothetical protein
MWWSFFGAKCVVRHKSKMLRSMSSLRCWDKSARRISHVVANNYGLVLVKCVYGNEIDYKYGGQKWRGL